MKDVASCPICGCGDLRALHEMTLREEDFREPERVRQKSGAYYRNWLLFEQIVGRDQPTLRFEFRACERCGLIFYSPRPTDADLRIKYEDIAQNKNTEEREEVRRVVDLRVKRGRAIRKVLEENWRIESGRALDIGGADGHCLGAMTSDFECAILDFETRDMWPGVRRLGSTLDDLSSDDLFDVVITCHTLEHVADPSAFIQQIAEHLSEGGVLYVEVPYGCGGEIHETHDVITHLNFFSEGSLGHLMESVGLHVEHLSSGAVLSRNRFLDVIQIVARKESGRPLASRYLDRGWEITRRQMEHTLDREVRAANIRLVLSRPLRYAVAFALRWRLMQKQRSVRS